MCGSVAPVAFQQPDLSIVNAKVPLEKLLVGFWPRLAMHVLLVVNWGSALDSRAPHDQCHVMKCAQLALKHVIRAQMMTAEPSPAT